MLFLLVFKFYLIFWQINYFSIFYFLYIFISLFTLQVLCLYMTASSLLFFLWSSWMGWHSFYFLCFILESFPCAWLFCRLQCFTFYFIILHLLHVINIPVCFQMRNWEEVNLHVWEDGEEFRSRGNINFNHDIT